MKETIGERRANELRRKWHVPAGPIDVFAFIRTRHELVLVRRFGDPQGIDGIYAFDAELQKGFIFVNRAKPGPRQRFTAAHELGHHCLDHRYRVDTNVYSTGDSKERDANSFAGAFLVPRSDLQALIPNHKIDLELILSTAHKFEVSPTALLVRLSVYGFITDNTKLELTDTLKKLPPTLRKKYPLDDENIKPGKPTDFPPEFEEAVFSAYLRGQLTRAGAAEALDLDPDAAGAILPDRTSLPRRRVPEDLF